MALTIPPTLFGAEAAQVKREQLIDLSEKLLTDWCHGLFAHQIVKPKNSSMHGGLWSRADASIIGRGGEAVYPFLWYADTYKDERYLDAAINVMNWSLINLSFTDGSWKNGVKDKWRGITVFIAIALAEAIKHHGSILDIQNKTEWLERLKLTGHWLYNTIDLEYGNINYPITNAYAMSLLGRLLDEPMFIARGEELAQHIPQLITKNHLIFGEGRNKKFPNNRSPKGCYPIDLGYNVEGSLPVIALYCRLTGDKKIEQILIKSLKAHLEFMLPDGGWDNSFGTRNYKWTWWGSRTTDGSQPAYALYANETPLFLEAAYRNTRLLDECTENGVLYGGPHYFSHGVAASLHHTFCHAKALTTILDIGIPEVYGKEERLPCEKNYGYKVFSDIDTTLVSSGGWRASFIGYDYKQKFWQVSQASGGALSLLWHHQAGPLITASMTRYKLIERFDMQKEEGEKFETLTPRLELKPKQRGYNPLDTIFEKQISDISFLNILDFEASVSSQSKSDGVMVIASSRMMDEDGHTPEFGNINSTISYQFFQDELLIKINPEKFPENYQFTYFFPVIAKQTERVKNDSEKSLVIDKGKFQIKISSNQAMTLPASLNTRIFNPVPGFEAIPISFSMAKTLTLSIKAVRA